MTPAEHKAITDKLAAIESKLDKVLKATLSQSGGEVADDRDLDSEWGDPVIKFDLRETDWQGASMEGKRFSQCPVEWLDAKAKSDASYAEYLRGPKKGTDEDLKKATYREKDAARARGWAKRLRSGWRPVGAARPQGAPPRAPTVTNPTGYGTAPSGGYGGGYGAPKENTDAEPPLDDGIPF